MSETRFSKGHKKPTFIDSKGKRILFTSFAFVLLYLVSYIINPFSEFWDDYFKRPLHDMLGEWVISFVFCFLISETSILIGKWLNRYIRWTERPGRRLAIETLLNLLAVMVLNGAIDVLFYIFSDDKSLSVIGTQLTMEKTKALVHWIVVSGLISLMIMAINIGSYLIVNWKDEAVRAAESTQLAMEAELQSLKLQIDPHFVFNNLSVLSELILENQQLGYEYAENFSKIYRYLLLNSKKDIISLEDEMKFLKAYMFLIKHRIGQGVSFDIQVSETSWRGYLPPLTLQLLVENALKHNKVVKSNPLQIRIYNTDDAILVVENTLLPIEQPLDSSGIGIRNIIRRYHLLSAASPAIEQDQHLFKVIIPLINYDQQNSDNRR